MKSSLLCAPWCQALCAFAVTLTLNVGCKSQSTPTPEPAPTAPAEQGTSAPQAPTTPPTTEQPAAPAAPAAPVATDQLKVGAWVIHNTKHEGYIEHQETKQRYVLYSQAQGMKDCKEGMPEDLEGAEPEYDIEGGVLSVVGDVVSYTITEGGFCGGAHPFNSTSFNTIDLKTGKPVELSALFEAKSIEDALNADKFVKELRAKRDQDLDDCKYMVMEPDAKTRAFAFHHVKGEEVAVRLGLSHSVEVCRGEFAQVGVYLKPKAELLKQLEQAKTAGLLMETLKPKVEAPK